MAARSELDRIVYAEIRRRRAAGYRDSGNVLDMLLAATEEDGSKLSDREVRDQAITLLFAGHDTTTSTVSFLLYELARNPHELAALYAEQDQLLPGGAPPELEHLAGGLPRLEMALDETLRLYPPAWIGPRRSVESCEIAGVQVPGNSYVNYCSWASHRLPEVPFGGGSRTCIGMRFGQMEIRAIATLLLQRVRLELQPGRTMAVRQMPTLSPRGGLGMVVRERGLSQSAGVRAACGVMLVD